MKNTIFKLDWHIDMRWHKRICRKNMSIAVPQASSIKSRGFHDRTGQCDTRTRFISRLCRCYVAKSNACGNREPICVLRVPDILLLSTPQWYACVFSTYWIKTICLRLIKVNFFIFSIFSFEFSSSYFEGIFNYIYHLPQFNELFSHYELLDLRNPEFNTVYARAVQ